VATLLSDSSLSVVVWALDILVPRQKQWIHDHGRREGFGAAANATRVVAIHRSGCCVCDVCGAALILSGGCGGGGSVSLVCGPYRGFC